MRSNRDDWSDRDPIVSGGQRPEAAAATAREQHQGRRAGRKHGGGVRGDLLLLPRRACWMLRPRSLQDPRRHLPPDVEEATDEEEEEEGDRVVERRRRRRQE